MSDLLSLVRLADACGDVNEEDLSSRVRTSHAAASFVAHLVKVRKAKVVAGRHFPHEVSDVEPVVRLVEAQDPTSAEHWETRYVLLLWMSVLALVPFDLARFDSGTEGRTPLMERILAIIKTYLAVANKTQDAAAYLASKFLTRPEITKRLLPEFLDWSMKAVVVDKSKFTDARVEVTRTGAMKALAAVHKQGKRKDLLPYSK